MGQRSFISLPEENVDLQLTAFCTSPPQAHQNPAGNWSEWMLAKLRLPNMMYEEVPRKPLDYYTCPFKASKIDK